MRRAAWIGVLVVALLSITATPSLAWRRAWSGGGHSGGSWSGGGHSGGNWHGGHGHVHGRVVVGVSPWWGWGWGYPYPYWGYYGPPYAYYPPPYPAPVVAQEQQTYAQTAPEPAPAAPQQPKAYWYYCASAGAYYPTAPTCPEVWIKVPPRSE
jgi:hypothetical protein